MFVLKVYILNKIVCFIKLYFYIFVIIGKGYNVDINFLKIFLYKC